MRAVSVVFPVVVFSHCASASRCLCPRRPTAAVMALHLEQFMLLVRDQPIDLTHEFLSDVIELFFSSLDIV